MTDADKLARYSDLANLVEELHDENMAMRVLLREAAGPMSYGHWSSEFRYSVEKALAATANKTQFRGPYVAKEQGK